MIDSRVCTSTDQRCRSANGFRYVCRKEASCKAASQSGGRFLIRQSPAGLVLLLAMIAGVFCFTGCAKKVIVPNVSQQDVTQAQQTLTAANLTPSVTGGSGPGAYVISQSPAAGQQVAANSTVNLVVELPVTVPALTNSNITDAVTTLQGLGLLVTFVKKPTVNPFGKTKVEEQSPAANSSVHRGAMVTLTVSTPPDISALLGSVAQEPAYQNLNPQYKKVLDQFLGNPSTSRSMDSARTPTTQNVPGK